MVPQAMDVLHIRCGAWLGLCCVQEEAPSEGPAGLMVDNITELKLDG